MVKVQIKSEQITPFGGIFCVMEEFDALLSNIIDSTLGLRTQDIRLSIAMNDLNHRNASIEPSHCFNQLIAMF